MGNSIASSIDPSRQIHAITAVEYSGKKPPPSMSGEENSDELQKAVHTFNVIISKLLEHQNQSQYMIKNEPETNMQKRSEVKAEKSKQSTFCYSRARSSSMGSSDEDTKVRYKNLFRKQSILDRTQGIVQNTGNSSNHGIFPPIVHSQNNLTAMYKIPEQNLKPNPSPAPMSMQNNVVPLNDHESNTSVINLPQILDESDEIVILRHLIQLLSGKVNKLNEEKKQLFQHISTMNQINQELVSIIQQRIKK